ncbi:PhoX family protein [Candidatus Planktophila dulcis]|uniref:alkaline phosphatase PhoX n=1 Tax=Candidatus Planktophila dulcis TaxID=1884914 RepID=UPI000BAC9E9F|nr:alkaline phosphatase PhoX [Candidatus Planktophila dulcis]ASY15151.1 PhoX family protein [Candidatus Planktophila dulcis]
MKLRYKVAAVLSIATLLAGTAVANSVLTKPEYITASTDAAEIKPLAYAGDTFSGFTIQGIPDGMGAMRNADGTITLLSVHEVPSYGAIGTLAKAADKGKAIQGTSITKFTLNKAGDRVLKASDMVTSWSFYNYNTKAYQASPVGAAPTTQTVGMDNFISRFCSATLVQAGALSFKDGSTTLGYEGAVFLSGEEDGDSGYGRGFAFDMDGNGINLPRMGLASWENLMPNLKPGKNTVVMGNEDGAATDSQLFMYVGTKTATGTFADKAGLTNGDLHVLSIPNIANDNAFRAAYGKNKAVDVKFEKTIWDADMKTQQLDHAAKGTEMTRVEDGEWDPSNPNVFYFLTTESNKDPGATTPNPATPSVSRDGGGLWRLIFVDGQKPELGAKLELLLDGTEAPFLSKPDNLAVTSDGVVLIQEDPGNNAQVARIVAFRVKDSKLATVAQFNPDHFSAGGSKFMTTDEESSGIIDVTSIVAKPGDTKKYFYFNAQVHTTGAYAARPDLTTKSPSGILKFNQKTLEGGAYYSLVISDWKTVFGS